MKRVRVSMCGMWVAITHAGFGEGAQMGPIGKVPHVQAVPRLRTRQQSTVRRVEAGGCIAEGGDKGTWGVSFAGCRELTWPALTHTHSHTRAECCEHVMHGMSVIQGHMLTHAQKLCEVVVRGHMLTHTHNSGVRWGVHTTSTPTCHFRASLHKRGGARACGAWLQARRQGAVGVPGVEGGRRGGEGHAALPRGRVPHVHHARGVHGDQLCGEKSTKARYA